MRERWSICDEARPSTFATCFRRRVNGWRSVRGPAMPFLPDLATAALYAVVVFLLVLGFLIVFVEAVLPSQLLALLITNFVVAGIFAFAAEYGLSLFSLAL